MKDIKNYLKTIGITHKYLAKQLNLSRPTLDVYIEYYENGKTIPKEKYAEAFERLFSIENGREDFLEILERVSGLLYQDYILGTSDNSMEETDQIANILNSIKKDLNTDDYSLDIYVFINALIHSYRDNIILYRLAEYFLYINGNKELKDIKKEQIPYLANFHKLFWQLTQDADNYDESDYLFFLERCEEIRIDNHNRETEKKIHEKVQKAIEKIAKSGKEISEEEILRILTYSTMIKQEASIMNIKSLYNEYNVTKSEERKIMDVMDKYRELINGGNEVLFSSYENDIIDIFGGSVNAALHIPPIEYHFCEYVARDYKLDGRWEEVFDNLYGEFSKYKNMI